ncbi:LexA family protein [Streptomyces sp. NPDC002306]
MTRGPHRQPATERPGALLRAHREWVTAYGEDPSLRELADAVGLSPSTVSHHLTPPDAGRTEIATRGWRSRQCPR